MKITENLKKKTLKASEKEGRMKSILAVGDSNTWGLVPGSRNRERYPWEIRWTGALQLQCGDIRIIEEGLCGRTTVFEDTLRAGRKGTATLPLIMETHHPLDAVIIMLGTNDCKTAYGASASDIGHGLEACLVEIGKYLPPDRILIVSPALLGENVWQSDKDPEFGPRSVEVCRELKAVYSQIAGKRGSAFLAASDYVVVNGADDEHFDEKGHLTFALAVYEKLKEMEVI